MAQALASKYGILANFGRRLMMRDIRDAVRLLHEVTPEGLSSLQDADAWDNIGKAAILDVASLYRDEGVNGEIIEDDQSDEAIYPSVLHAYELWFAMRKLLNMVTNYKHRDYFDNVSPVQALVHLVNDNYEPHDIEF